MFTFPPAFFLFLLAVPIAALAMYVLRRHPSNDGDWSLDQMVLPHATFSGDKVTVHAIRNFSYRTVADFTAGYYDKTFDLGTIERAYLIIEPFSRWKGVAHTLLSFEFKNGDCLALSVEVRKEKGYEFFALRSGILGLFRQYEIMYALADERDVVKLRSNYRRDTIYLYPVKTSRGCMQTALRSILLRANKLSAEPEFYHTITNSCSSNLATHLFELTQTRIPLSLRLFPREMDRYLFEHGLIDTKLPFAEVRSAHRINDLALRYADDPDFSFRIRGR